LALWWAPYRVLDPARPGPAAAAAGCLL